MITRAKPATKQAHRQHPNQRLLAMLMAGSALTLPGAALAQNWVGGTSTDYNTANNWSNNTVPADTFVEINTNTNAPVISAGQNGTARSINVGLTNTAALTVQQGGTLVVGTPANGGSLSVGGGNTNATTGNGTVRVTGVGSAITVNGALNVAISQNSRGLVEILNGGTITGAAPAIATGAGSIGTVTISGAGSRWDNGSANGLFIGNLADATGRGTLNVLDGGAYAALAANTSVNVRGGSAVNVIGANSLLQSRGGVFVRNGTFTVASSGAAESDTLVIDGVAGLPDAVVNVNGGTITVNRGITIGSFADSTGELAITNGGVLRAQSLLIGFGGGSRGQLNVEGAGSLFELTSNSEIVIGGATASPGFGDVAIRGGGRFVGNTNRVSLARGSTLLVSGQNSTFDHRGNLTVGGTATITGPGALANAFSLNVGQSVPAGGAPDTVPPSLVEVLNGGTLRISNGGDFGTVGSSSSAIVRVSGAGSTLDFAQPNGADINIATRGSRLEILDGARLLGAANWGVRVAGGLRVSGQGTDASFGNSVFIGTGSAALADAGLIVENNGIFRVNRLATGGSNAGPEGSSIIVRSGGQLIATDFTLSGNFSGGPRSVLLIEGGSVTANTLGSISNTRNEIILGGAAGSAPGAVVAFNVGAVSLLNTDFVINHTGTNFILPSRFTGSSSVIRHLAGTTVLTGLENSSINAPGNFQGETLLTGGTLRANGSFGNSVHVMTVSNGATLGGSGRIGGNVTITNATLAPGNSAGNLTFGNNLVLSADSILAFELGAPGGTAGVDSDLITVLGNLTLDGTLNVTDAGGFGAGLYRLINYNGTLTDNGLTLGVLPGGVDAGDLSVQTSVARQVNLIVSAPTPPPPPVPTSFPFWDGSATTANGMIEGGSGTWTATGTNWTTTAATANGAYNPQDLLIFTGPMAGTSEPGQTLARVTTQVAAATPSASAGTVTVDGSAGAITLRNGMQFAVTGYTLTGADIVLAATEPCGECSPLPGQTIIRVGDGTNASTGFVTTIASRLTGESGLLKTDRGTLILSGANTYAGGTEIAGGMVQGTSASLQGTITIGSSGTLLFTQEQDGEFETGLSGSGIFAKQGAGKLLLSGNSAAFAGTTVLTGGELAVDGTLGSALSTLQAGAAATLSGSGRIGGSVAVDDAIVAPGGSFAGQAEARLAAAAQTANQIGLLTIDGNFSLTGASFLAFQLGDPAGEAGIASDLINVGGNLVLDGTLNVTDAGGFGAGLYRLINYDGALTNNGLGIGVTPEGFVPADLMVQTSVANQVNLLVSTPVTNFNFWDGANTSSNGAANGGTGTWRADTTNWTVADGNRNGTVDPAQLLIFAGTAGTVTVDDAGGAVRTSAGLQFATGGYRIEGGAIALDGPASTMRVGDGTEAGASFTATIASALTGAAQLDKTDLGTLILSGGNGYTGGTRVLGGALQIADDGALGATSGAITLDGGTLRNTAALTSARSITIGSGGGTIDSGANALVLSGTIGGTGTLRLTGSSARTLSGNSSAFTGSTTLAAGSLALSGSLGGLLTVAAPATLTGVGRAGSLDLAGTFSPGAAAGATGTFNVTGDLTIRAGSTLRIDVAASGATDRIEVGGRALIEGGNVAVMALDPDVNYTNGTNYRIVNAASGRNGTFAGLTESSAFLDFALGYDPTGAFLTTTVIRQFPDVAQTFNQREASSALKDLGRVAGSDALAVYNAILILDADPARAAFDASSGEIYPTLLAGRQRAGMALAGRMAARGAARGNEGLAMWGGILGERANVDADADFNGAHSKADSFGLESGLDFRGPDNRWAFGIGGGWQDGNVHLATRGSRAKIDAWHIGAYARYGTGGAGFSTVASVVLCR